MADNGRQVGHNISVNFIQNKALDELQSHKSVVSVRRATLCGDESGVGSGDVVCGEGEANISTGPVWRLLYGHSPPPSPGGTQAPSASPQPPQHTNFPPKTTIPCFDQIRCEPHLQNVVTT